MTIPRINGPRPAPAIDLERSNPKRAAKKAAPSTDILQRLPVQVANAAFSFLDTPSVAAVSIASKNLYTDLTAENGQNRRLWSDLAKRVPTPVRWPAFSTETVRDIKASVLEPFDLANQTLAGFDIPHLPLKLKMKSYAKVESLTSAIRNPFTRFYQHTLPTIKAIEASDPKNELFFDLMTTYGEGYVGRGRTIIPNDPHAFFNLFFFCGVGWSPTLLGSFVRVLKEVHRDFGNNADVIEPWMSMLEWIVSNHPKHTSESIHALANFYPRDYEIGRGHLADHAPSIENQKRVSTLILGLLKKGIAPCPTSTELCVHAVTKERYAPSYEALEAVLSASPEPLLTHMQYMPTLAPISLMHDLVTALLRCPEKTPERGDKILKMLGRSGWPEGVGLPKGTRCIHWPSIHFLSPKYVWDENMSKRTCAFAAAAEFGNPALMQEICSLGYLPVNNDDALWNTLSYTLGCKKPSPQVIEFMCLSGAKPCAQTFELIDHYSQNLETRQALHKLLSEHS